MAVIDGSARSATAIASAPNTKVMRINHARFVYLVSQQPAFALMVMDALVEAAARLQRGHLPGGTVMSERKPTSLPILMKNDILFADPGRRRRLPAALHQPRRQRLPRARLCAHRS